LLWVAAGFLSGLWVSFLFPVTVGNGGVLVLQGRPDRAGAILLKFAVVVVVFHLELCFWELPQSREAESDVGFFRELVFAGVVWGALDYDARVGFAVPPFGGDFAPAKGSVFRDVVL
jgi:hypothetical protein